MILKQIFRIIEREIKEYEREVISSPSSNNSNKMNKLVSDPKSLSYDPVHFIRAHSKRDDPSDNQTQVRLFNELNDRGILALVHAE